MPTIQGVTSTAAGATTQNVLTGSVYEYLPWNARLEFGICGDAAGEGRVTVLSGSDTVLEESSVSRQARFPVYPDDFSLIDVARGGERVVIRHRNTGVGANNLFWAVRITPLR
jgi:hypothetical protein